MAIRRYKTNPPTHISLSYCPLLNYYLDLMTSLIYVFSYLLFFFWKNRNLRTYLMEKNIVSNSDSIDDKGREFLVQLPVITNLQNKSLYHKEIRCS